MLILGLETFFDNLSSYYVVAVCASVLAVIVSVYYSLKLQNHNSCPREKVHTLPAHSGEHDEIVDDDSVPQEGIDPVSKEGKKSARMAEKVIEANMTEEQRSLELEIRKQQLAEIYKLMQQETDKFGDVSYLELEEQMKLYQ